MFSFGWLKRKIILGIEKRLFLLYYLRITQWPQAPIHPHRAGNVSSYLTCYFQQQSRTSLIFFPPCRKVCCVQVHICDTWKQFMMWLEPLGFLAGPYSLLTLCAASKGIPQIFTEIWCLVSGIYGHRLVLMIELHKFGYSSKHIN